MENMTFDKILQSFLNLNIKTEEKIYKKTKFLDEELEEEYRKETTKNLIKNKKYTEKNEQEEN